MEDLTISSQYDESGKRKERFLDTKGFCFVCLHPLSSVTDNSNNEEGRTKVCFRNICRFMSISTHTILAKSLDKSVVNRNEEISYQRDKCDFSVTLCPNCTDLTNNLSELIRQKELIEMLMKHELEVFNQILNKSDEGLNGNSIWRNVKDQMTLRCGNSREAGIVENFREEVKKKCLGKVKLATATAFPKIQLLPQERKPETATAAITNKRARTEAKISGLTRYPTAIKQLVSSIFTNNSENVVTKSGNRFRCRLCKKSKTTYHKSTLIRHLVNMHPGKLFIHKKLPNMSEEIFNVRCKQHLRSEANQGKDRSTSVLNPAFTCSICNDRYMGIYNIQYHLALEHYPILEENLEKALKAGNMGNSELKPGIIIQKDTGQWSNILSKNRRMMHWKHRSKKTGSARMKPINLKTSDNSEEVADPKNLNESLQKDDIYTEDVVTPKNDNQSSTFAKNLISSICTSHSKEVNGGGHKCLICKRHIRSRTLQKHMVNMHTEKFFVASKPPGFCDQLFRQRCKRILKSESDKASAQNGHHAVDGQFQEIVCIYCPHKCFGGLNYRHHLIQQHYNIFQEQLTSLQGRNKMKHENPPVNSEVNGIKRKVTEERHQTKKRKTKPGNQWVCSVANGGCGGRYSCIYSLKQHIKGYCPNRRANQGVGKSPEKIAAINNDQHCNIIPENLVDLQRENTTQLQKSHENSKINKMKRKIDEKRKMTRKRKINPGNQWLCSVASGGCGGRYSSIHTLKQHMKGYCPNRRTNQEKSPEKMAAIQNDQPCNISPDKLVGVHKENTTQLQKSHENSKLKIKRKIAERRKIKQKRELMCSVANGGCGGRYSSIGNLKRHIQGYCPKRINNGGEKSTENLTATNGGHNQQKDMEAEGIRDELNLGEKNYSRDAGTSSLHNPKLQLGSIEDESDKEDVNDVNGITEAEEVAINNFNALISDLKRFV